MKAGTVATVAFLLALYLFPVTAYLAFARPVAIPLEYAGAGQDNCGYIFYVLHQGPRPGSDRDSVPPCEQPRQEAVLFFGLVATANSGLLAVAAGYGAKARLNKRRGSAA